MHFSEHARGNTVEEPDDLKQPFGFTEEAFDVKAGAALSKNTARRGAEKVRVGLSWDGRNLHKVTQTLDKQDIGNTELSAAEAMQALAEREVALMPAFRQRREAAKEIPDPAEREAFLARSDEVAAMDAIRRIREELGAND